jgi:hypothetical protein
MELNATTKRWLAIGLVAIAIFVVLWLLGLRPKMGTRTLPTAVGLAPEAVRAGGTNEGALPSYFTINAPYTGGTFGVQPQPPAPFNACCDPCGASGLLSTQGQLLNSLNAQNSNWLDAYSAQLDALAPPIGIDYGRTTDAILNAMNQWVGYGYSSDFVQQVETLVADQAPLGTIQSIIGNWMLSTTSSKNAPAVSAITAAANNPYIYGI